MAKENLHYHIINNCIYAADIDIYAIQITTINLLLKDTKSYVGKVNVANCDSLIRWEKDFNPTIKFLDNKYKYKTYKIKIKALKKLLIIKKKRYVIGKHTLNCINFGEKNLIIL
ncbi:hypothetical protein JTT01_07640 [Clostridium botulinum]|nr:hypothetical protein [Clostridium botulinum]